MRIPNDKEWAAMSSAQRDEFASVFNSAIAQVVAQVMICAMPSPPRISRNADGREMVELGDANVTLMLATSTLTLLAVQMGLTDEQLLMRVGKSYHAAIEAEKAGAGSSALMKAIADLVHQTVKAVIADQATAQPTIITPAQA